MLICDKCGVTITHENIAPLVFRDSKTRKEWEAENEEFILCKTCSKEIKAIIKNGQRRSELKLKSNVSRED